MSVRPSRRSDPPTRGLRVVCYLGAPTETPVPVPSPAEGPSCAPPGFQGEILVVAVDGGLDALLAASDGARSLPEGFPRKWHWIGDGDSLGRPSPEERLGASGVTMAVTRLPVEKDVSDFGAALDALAASLCASDTLRDIVIEVHGGLGGRRDHELCNLLEAVEFVEARRARMAVKRGGASRRGSAVVTFPGAFHVVSGSVAFFAPEGALFSLASPRGGGKVTVTGALYGGELELRRGSHGLSNVASGGPVAISTEGVVIVALA